ncbi:hypothetical protein ACS3SW_05615 [Roseobacteraceae bacterium S113]
MGRVVQNAHGMLLRGKAFAHSAAKLFESTRVDPAQLSFVAPIDYLLPHSIELQFKAALIGTFPERSRDIERRGHNLTVLLGDMKSDDALDELLMRANKFQRTEWKQKLGSVKADFERSLSTQPMASNELLPTNAEIGQSLPDIWPVIVHLSRLNTHGRGGVLRYFSEGLQTRQRHRLFDYDVDTIHRSLTWALPRLADLIGQLDCFTSGFKTRDVERQGMEVLE